MANVKEKFGLRPYRKLDGTPLVGAQNRYTIASNMGHAIFQGDLVIVTTAGNIEKYIMLTISAVIYSCSGRFQRCVLYRSNYTKANFQKFYPGQL